MSGHTRHSTSHGKDFGVYSNKGSLSILHQDCEIIWLVFKNIIASYFFWEENALEESIGSQPVKSWAPGDAQQCLEMFCISLLVRSICRGSWRH